MSDVRWKDDLDFAAATERQKRLDAAYMTAARALGAMSGGGSMGMTPANVRATPEWKAAKAASDAAFAAFRAFNANYMRRFAREIAASRRGK